MAIRQSGGARHKGGRSVVAPTELKLVGRPRDLILRCARCSLTFVEQPGLVRECPACRQEQVIQDLRTEYMRLQQQYDMLSAEYERTRAHVDLVMAMREALALVDQDDLLFLKRVLYRWKDDRGVNLRVTHAPPPVGKDNKPVRGATAMPNGLLVLYRGDDDAESWKPSSPGGVALAGYFDEALRINGHPHAMDTLLRAMNQHLPGGLK